MDLFPEAFHWNCGFGVGVWGLMFGFRVWGLGFGVWGLGFTSTLRRLLRISLEFLPGKGLRFIVRGFGFWVLGLCCVHVAPVVFIPEHVRPIAAACGHCVVPVCGLGVTVCGLGVTVCGLRVRICGLGFMYSFVLFCVLGLKHIVQLT